MKTWPCNECRHVIHIATAYRSRKNSNSLSTHRRRLMHIRRSDSVLLFLFFAFAVICSFSYFALGNLQMSLTYDFGHTGMAVAFTCARCLPNKPRKSYELFAVCCSNIFVCNQAACLLVRAPAIRKRSEYSGSFFFVSALSLSPSLSIAFSTHTMNKKKITFILQLERLIEFFI